MGITAFPFTAVIDVPTARILGRDDAGTGAAEALTNTDIFAILGTGTPSASTYLRGDGTWAAVSAGISSLNGLTDATQTFAVGTTGTNVAFSSAAGVHTLNIPDASATARGVVTTSTQTLAGSKTFTTAIKVALPSTSTNNLGNSNPPDTQWVYLVNTTNLVNRPIGIVFGGYDGFYHLALQSTMTSGGGNTFGKVSFVGQQGFEYLRVSTASTNLGVTIADGIKFAAFSTNLSIDCAIERDAANTLGQRNGVNAQSWGLYNTYTSATSYERLNIAWASNICTIEATAGSAGGTLRGLRIGGASTSLLGFYGATPVDRPDTITDPTGGGTIDAEARAAINTIIDRLQELGLIA